MRNLLDPAYESFCRAGELVDCESATGSRFGSVGGVPLAAIGLAAYLAMFLLAGTTALLPLAVTAAIAALVLAAISAFVLRVLCPLCLATWVVDFALAGFAWRWRASALPPSRLRIAIAVCPAVAIVAASALATPRAVALEGWREGVRLPHGFTADGHPWIGAKRPTLTLDEYVDYACPHCRVVHARIRAELARNPRVRIVRHDWARMGCLPVPPNRENVRCVFARAARCAGEQGRFWEMNDYLFSHMSPQLKVNLEEAARRVNLHLEAFDKCLHDRKTYVEADRENDHARDDGIRGTPGYVMGGRLLKAKEAIGEIRNAR